MTKPNVHRIRITADAADSGAAGPRSRESDLRERSRKAQARANRADATAQALTVMGYENAAASQRRVAASARLVQAQADAERSRLLRGAEGAPRSKVERGRRVLARRKKPAKTPHGKSAQAAAAAADRADDAAERAGRSDPDGRQARRAWKAARKARGFESNAVAAALRADAALHKGSMETAELAVSEAHRFAARAADAAQRACDAAAAAAAVADPAPDALFFRHCDRCGAADPDGCASVVVGADGRRRESICGDCVEAEARATGVCTHCLERPADQGQEDCAPCRSEKAGDGVRSPADQISAFASEVLRLLKDSWGEDGSHPTGVSDIAQQAREVIALADQIGAAGDPAPAADDPY